MTFDINSRMEQWDAAGRMHGRSETQTERILKSIESFQRTNVPLPADSNAQAKADMFRTILTFLRDSGLRPEDLVEFLSLHDKKMSPDTPVEAQMGALSAALAPPAERTISGTPTELDRYLGHMDDAQDPRAPMNRIGADKPRSKFIGEGGYDEFTAGPEDQTEIRGKDLFGLPANYGGLSARAEDGKEKAESIYEGE